MTTGLRILWICPYLPLAVFGGGTRVYNLLNALVEGHGAVVDLVAVAERQEQIETPPPELTALCRRLLAVPSPVLHPTARRRRQVRALLSRRPAQYWLSYLPEVQGCIDAALREQSYDLAIIEHSFAGYYRLPPHLPRVLDQHNVESTLLHRAAQTERTPLRRAFNYLEYLKFREHERRLCAAVDLILATSRYDQRQMQHWPGAARCIVVPNGVDTAAFQPGPELATEPPTLLYTAAMHYAPNVEAMLFFVAEIWPLVRRAVPDAVLQIVGGGAPRAVARLDRHDNITLTGYVPDVRVPLARAQVVIVPLRIGGGTRLKIVEALAMGKAVVSTTLGCEGLAVEHDRQLLIADTPTAFAQAVVALLHDPARRTALGTAGRLLMERVYDWRAIGATLAGELVHCAAPHTAPPDDGRSP